MNWWDKDSENIWHPFTQHGLAPAAVPIVKGEGAILTDAHGKTYIDAVSSWWVNTWGHGRPEIAEAIARQAKQLEQVIFAGFTHEPAVTLAGLLLELLPDKQQKVFFSDNGSTSVEVGLKMAIQYWHNRGTPRRTIIAMENGYHGDTFGAMSAGKSDFFSAFDTFLFDVVQLPVPDDANIDSVMARFEVVIAEGQTAAFLFEPLLQGSGGMRMYQPEHLDRLIGIAQQQGVICIADEVLTGFGRTGKVFASDHLDNKPDIFCLSKGITGGFLPLGVTTCSLDIYNAFLSDDKRKTFFHGHSYTANPLSCSAAIAAMGLLQREGNTIGELARRQEAMRMTLAGHPKTENLRQLGTVVAFEVKTDTQSDYFNDLRDRLYNGFLERGVLLRPLGNTVYILPPYCITETQLQRVYQVITEVLDSL